MILTIAPATAAPTLSVRLINFLGGFIGLLGCDFEFGLIFMRASGLYLIKNLDITL
jgi:hypothetical protein